ncbi:hypothetical protein CRUP_000674 [Coryphaenoides rupestris]|nr:hypothetical protein CRUP_000674 [Coryphaenoides rupestris]
MNGVYPEVTLKEVGLEGALFLLLDQEKEEVIRRDIQETLLHLLVSSVQRGKLLPWIKLCKNILSASTDSGVGPGAEEEAERADDWSEMEAGSLEGAGPFSMLGWRTREFAMRCLSRLVQLCQPAGPAHFNMALALEQRLNQPGCVYMCDQHKCVCVDLLVLHLGDLVQVSFMGATDPCGGVRVEGLQALLLLINTFCCSEEPELPGHRLLEQYQANVGAALSPAFSADAPPDVTAIACQVCSAWLSSGVVGDLRDLRRVHQLLASSLAKLEGGRDRPSPLYNEATVTMETLAVLQAWAEVYIVAVQRSREGEDHLANEDTGSAGAGLLKLVQSDLPTLSRLWLAALQDYAHLTRPQEVTSKLPATGGGCDRVEVVKGGGCDRVEVVVAGGVFFTAETKHQARSHYTSCWAPILHAYALWMQSTGFGMSDEEPASLSRPATPTSMGQSDSVGGAKSPEEISSDRLNLILGISVSFLCEDQTENITSCLRALGALLSDPWPRGQVGGDQGGGGAPAGRAAIGPADRQRRPRPRPRETLQR